MAHAPYAPRKHVPGGAALVLLFAIAISLPGLGLLLGFGRGTISESERRELAPWPVWAWSPVSLTNWPAAFERYFDDHFALRAELIDWRSRLLWSGLGTSASDTVIAGRDGWLFYADDGAVRDWTQEEPFPREEMEVWRQTLLKRRAFLARRGIHYLFAIAPDKQMIYPEYMPGTLRRLRDDYRADQLVAYMHETTPDFDILDLREAVRRASKAELVYHHYDTHWNDRGALAAYQAIAARLTRWFPGLTPLERADFDTSAVVASGDATTLLGLSDPGKAVVPGLVLRRGTGYRIVAPARQDPYGEDPVIIVEHRDRTLPTAMVFRDSFGTRLIPYVSEHFSRVDYYWQNELDYAEIDRGRPDVVIQEFVARHFYTFGPYPPDIPE